MPSLEQKAVMVSPVSFCLLTSSRIFDSLIIFKLFWLKINQPQQLVKDVLRRMLTSMLIATTYISIMVYLFAVCEINRLFI